MLTNEVNTGFNTSGGTGGIMSGGGSVLTNAPQFPWLQGSNVFQQQALGQAPTNAPQQTGVSQGLQLASDLNTVSSVASSANKATTGPIGKLQSTVTDITSGIDAIGGELGFGNVTGAPVAGGVGPTNIPQAGALGTKASLSNVLGGAGLGYMAGGYLGKLFGGSTVGGQVGGALGGALGSATLGGLSTGLGTSLGALGSIVPGVGTVLGAVGGSLIGSFFGKKKPPNPESGFSMGLIDKTGVIKDSTYGAKHVGTDVGQNLESEFSQFLQNQARRYGIDYSGDVRVSAAYSPREKAFGGKNSGIAIFGKDETNPFLRRGEAQFNTFNIDDDKSKQQAFEAAWKNIMQRQGVDVSTLQPINNAGQTVFARTQQTESPFEKFLKDYRAKQNANIA